MARYDMKQYHFAIFPTDDIKQFVIWRMTADSGHEAFHGTLPECLYYLRTNAPAPLPGDTVTVSDLPDATWWEVLHLLNGGTRLEIREAGTDYASQFIDRSIVKQHKRRVI